MRAAALLLLAGMLLPAADAVADASAGYRTGHPIELSKYVWCKGLRPAEDLARLSVHFQDVRRGLSGVNRGQGEVCGPYVPHHMRARVEHIGTYRRPVEEFQVADSTVSVHEVEVMDSRHPSAPEELWYFLVINAHPLMLHR